MRTFFAALVLMFVSAGSPAPSQAASLQFTEATPGRVTAVVGVTVLPMTRLGLALTDHTVLIQGHRIVGIGPSTSLQPPVGARVIDGAGRYLMPGLADMHVHLEYIENPDILKLFLAYGVTTVRSMDGRPFMLDWRRKVADGSADGPRIVTAGPIIDGSPPARDDNLAVADGAAARAAVRDQAAAGYDFIKTYVNLSPEAYRAVLEEAGSRGLPVAGHTPRGVPLLEAASAQWSLEHLGDFVTSTALSPNEAPGWSRRFMAAPLDREKVRALARQLAAIGVWVVPTLIEKDRSLATSAVVETWLAEPATRDVGSAGVGIWSGAMQGFQSRLGADDWRWVEQARLNRLELVRMFHEAGVRMVVGSDTPNPFVVPGQSVHLELANFVAAGFTPEEALRAATALPAEMLGAKSDSGTVQVGKRADLLLLNADPRLNIGAAQDRVGIFASGRWYDEARLRDMRNDLSSE